MAGDPGNGVGFYWCTLLSEELKSLGVQYPERSSVNPESVRIAAAIDLLRAHGFTVTKGNETSR
jgi:hypothetical protein